MGGYQRPATVENALALAARGATLLAGGTDYYPVRVARPLRTGPDEMVLDLSGGVGLGGIAERDEDWRIGAATTWTTVAEARLPPQFVALQLAAREIGGRQIQNRATVGGNIANASPAADGVPPLMSLGARVEVCGAGGKRTLPIAEFIIGPRQTALASGEILTAVLVPKSTPGVETRSHFLKLGARASLVISIVMVAGVIETRAGLISAARIAVGACSPVALRLPDLEQALIGRVCDTSLATVVAPQHLAALAPIDDVRATAGYRRQAALTLTRRLLETLGDAA